MDETTNQITEPYFETSTTLNMGYQISEPYAESSINEVYKKSEPYTKDEMTFDNTVYQASEPEISTNIDYNFFNKETTFDNKTFKANEPYNYIEKEEYTDTTSTIVESSSQKNKNFDDINKGYEGFDNVSYTINEPLIEESSNFDKTTNLDNEQYGKVVESFDSYNVSDNYDATLTELNSSTYQKTDPLTEIITTFDETPFQINEPYFETAITVDTTSYQLNGKKAGETFNDTSNTITEPYIETTTTFDDNIDKYSDPYFEASTTIDIPHYKTSFEEKEENNINYQKNEPFSESSVKNDNKAFQKSEEYGQVTTNFNDIDYQSIESCVKASIESDINDYQKAESFIETEPLYNISNSKKTKLNENITSTFDFNNYTNIKPEVDTTSTLETTDYINNTQNFNISSALEKDKTQDESAKQIFDYQTFETNEYQGDEIYDIIDNFTTSEYKTSSPIKESYPNFLKNKREKTTSLQTLDNKNETIGTSQVTEAITKNFNYSEYKTSKPIIETTSTYQEFKPSYETTSTIETTNFITATPSLEKHSSSFDFSTLGVENLTTDGAAFKEKEPITSITSFETYPEFDFASYNTGKPYEITTNISPKVNASNVTTKNIAPEYGSKTYEVKMPTIKTEFDFTNLGTSSNYDTGAGYNEYKTTTLKKTKQKLESDIALPTIKTLSKPAKTTTTKTFLQSASLLDDNEILKDYYETVQDIKEAEKYIPKKEIVTSSISVPTKIVTKTEYIQRPKISSYSKPATITSYTKPYKIEVPPIPSSNLPEPIIPSFLDSGAIFDDYKNIKKEKKVQSVYSPTYNQRIIKSSSAKSLVPHPQISMVPQISIVPQPVPIKKIKKVDPIIIKIPKIQKVYIPKIKKVYIPRKQKIYINKPSSITSYNQQISYIPKPSLSVTKPLSIVSPSSTYNYIQKTIPLKSSAPVQVISTYPLKAYSSPKIIKYDQNVISQIPNMKAIVPIQSPIQIPSTKHSNRTYITPRYASPNIYSGSSFNSSKSRNNLNLVGNKYISRTYQARKL